MWSRIRLDISWSELIREALLAIWPDDHVVAQSVLEAWWSNGRQDSLACLSVRSGFDLLLQALQLPEESEVLFSAVNIPGMAEIARAHRLVPVPVDVCGSDLHLDLSSLESALTERSRMLVVAHLFGSRLDLSELANSAKRNKLILVEDCAQAWCELSWRGSPDADVSLFSFGPIKTATAFGGALCRIRDPEVLDRMKSIQSQWPIQSKTEYLRKLCKLALLKLISTKWIYGIVSLIGRMSGKNVADLIGQQARGFPSGPQLDPLRRQSSASLLKVLHHRLSSYDLSRIERRVRNARRLIDNLKLQAIQPELNDRQHTFWLFPLLSDDAENLIAVLNSHGFDATQRGRLQVLSPPADRLHEGLDPVHARELLRQIVFIPCNSEMPVTEIDRMSCVIRDFTDRKDTGRPCGE